MSTEEKLARSLTAETTELLPFLPYLLQDLWELGSSPKDMIALIKKNLTISKDTKILDLACGKGAVSIQLAQELKVDVYGYDIIPEFIEYARKKAKELQVDPLCHFETRDVNEAVTTEKNYDCVIFGAAGNVLGSPKETLMKLISTIKPNGFILMDEAYLPDGFDSSSVKYQCDYMTHKQWLDLFQELGLKLLEEQRDFEEHDYEFDNKAIQKRAHELIQKHPEKRMIFEGYVKSQLNECDDLENSIIGVTWMLQKP
jgi:ubiquinone/menaquinone biosynthesis C-methylase UbiE